jgi:hypothetical protein
MPASARQTRLIQAPEGAVNRDVICAVFPSGVASAPLEGVDGHQARCDLRRFSTTGHGTGRREVGTILTASPKDRPQDRSRGSLQGRSQVQDRSLILRRRCRVPLDDVADIHPNGSAGPRADTVEQVIDRPLLGPVLLSVVGCVKRSRGLLSSRSGRSDPRRWNTSATCSVRVFKERPAQRDAADVTSSKAPRHRSLAPIDSIRELRRDHGLVVYGHLRPARVRLRPSCRDRGPQQLARVK